MKNLLFMSWDKSNSKTSKEMRERSYLGVILHLSPYWSSDISINTDLNEFPRVFSYRDGKVNLCPSSSKGCRTTCIFYSGRAQIFPHINRKRDERTRLFVRDLDYSLREIIRDLNILEEEARKKKLLPICRFGGTSDIGLQYLYFWPDLQERNGRITLPEWKVKYPSIAKRKGVRNIFQMFPNIQFYEYTKRVDLVDNIHNPPNLHYTFSRSESNEYWCKKFLEEQRCNVAVVFRKSIPKTFWGFPTVNGDRNDLRFLDPNPKVRPVIVGLKAKGSAKTDQTGFVVDN